MPSIGGEREKEEEELEQSKAMLTSLKGKMDVFGSRAKLRNIKGKMDAFECRVGQLHSPPNP